MTNAIKFIQQHGVEKAREVVTTNNDLPSYTFKVKKGSGYSACHNVDLYKLKRIVESLDLIKFYGGIERAKLLLAMGTCLADRPPHAREVQLEQAIADYESIYGGEHV